MNKRVIAAFLFGFAVVSLSFESFSAAPPGFWEIRPSPTVADLFAITAGAGKFLAVGSEGTVLTSPNGSYWSPGALASPDKLRSVTYGNGLFVAGGEGNNLLSRSVDGVQWTHIASAANMERVNGLTYANGRFVGVGSIPSGPGGALQAFTMTSLNGVDWVPATPAGGGLRAVTFGNGMFVAVGDQATILTSADGASWALQSSPITNDLGAVTWFLNSKFVASGMFGYSLNSSDGFNWVEVSRASFTVRSIASGVEYLVAVGRSGTTGRIQASGDGFGWPGENLIFPNMMWGVVHANNNWIAVGEGGMIIQSDVSHITLQQNPGTIDLLLTGPAGKYRIEGSSNLKDWVSLGQFDFFEPLFNRYVMRADDPSVPSLYLRASLLTAP